MTVRSQAQDRLSRRAAVALGFLVFSLLGALEFFYHYLNDLARGITGTAAMRALEEFTGVYAAGLLFMLVVLLVRRFPPRRGAWRPIAVYLAALPVFSVAHTSLMLVSRDSLAPLLGLGRYNYGDLWYRFPMEFANQVIVFATMIGGVWIADLYRDNHRRELAAARLRDELSQAQLRNLRLQLQPHFLFNTLNTISSVMYEDVGRADAMLAGLSDLLRHTLAGGDVAEVPLRQELEICRLFLEIMQARFDNQLRIEYAIAPEALEALVPHFLLQPLVENAVRHGAGGSGGRIAIHAHRQRQELVLQVDDSGSAPGSPAHPPGHGIGLSNTTQRLEKLYGAAHSFQAGAAAEGGFSVRLSFPFRLQPEGV